MSPLKSLPPPIGPQCRLIAALAQDGKPIIQDDGSEIFVDLSGGADHIEWVPSLRVVEGVRCNWVQVGQDTYSLRVWKRQHGWLNVASAFSSYDELPYADLWADWLEEHIECGFLIAGVEFKIMSVSPSRNGVEYWLTGRRVSTTL